MATIGAMRASILVVMAVTTLVACRPAFDLADRQDIFALPGDGGVMCAASVEWQHVDQGVIDDALDRATADRQIVELFAHDPGVTVPVDKLDMVLADAEARGLRFVTYRELAGGVSQEAGLAFSFDDWSVDHWRALRDVVRRHGARVTFFVARYDARCCAA